jgi:hypothetical protein
MLAPVTVIDKQPKGAGVEARASVPYLAHPDRPVQRRRKVGQAFLLAGRSNWEARMQRRRSLMEKVQRWEWKKWTS